MSLKIVAPASLIVMLSATVALAQEGAKPNEGKKTKDAEACPPDVPEMPACPPETPTAAPRPPAPVVMPVSFPEPAPRPVGPEPVPFDAEAPATSFLDLSSKNAFELGFQGGYVQPFGGLEQNLSMSDVADPGGAASLDFGWRINPSVMIGITGQFFESVVNDNLGSDMAVRGGAAGPQVTAYLAPYSPVNPYLTLGAGWRSMWIINEGDPAVDDVVYHGVDLARAQFGLDFRVARDFSFGPNAGAALNMMFFKNGDPDNVGDDQIEDPRPSAFVFAGLAGRFEIGGTHVSKDVYYGNAPQAEQTTASR